jgi:hypothetical protein
VRSALIRGLSGFTYGDDQIYGQGLPGHNGVADLVPRSWKSFSGELESVRPERARDDSEKPGKAGAWLG